MTTTFDDALAHVRHLDIPDRIRLTEMIWDEMALATERVQLPQELCEELDRRIERHERHSEEASSWATVRARIEGRS